MAFEAVRFRNLQDRLKVAKGYLSHCLLCPQMCGVDRVNGELGLCHAGIDAHYFDATVHYGDELELTPNYAISFNGCNMRCGYCITAKNSFFGDRGVPFDVEHFAQKLETLGETSGTLQVNWLHLLGGEPAIHIWTLLRLLEYVPESLQVMLNTNLYFSSDILALLDGLVDLYVVDLKYAQDECAIACSKSPKYWETMQDNLAQLHKTEQKWFFRHLLIPGHFSCCTEPILDWIQKHYPSIPLSIRHQYVPAKVSLEGALGRFLKKKEVEQAFEAADQRALRILR